MSGAETARRRVVRRRIGGAEMSLPPPEQGAIMRHNSLGVFLKSHWNLSPIAIILMIHIAKISDFSSHNFKRYVKIRLPFALILGFHIIFTMFPVTVFRKILEFQIFCFGFQL